jgi:hypothetical protein
MVRLARMAGVVLALGACGGGSGDSSSPAHSSADPAPDRAATTTATAPSTGLDVRRPIPANSLHGTPRPPLVNTGDDPVAIFESLAANFRWLTENPDPALVDELFVPGTADHAQFRDLFAALAASRWRSADEGYAIASIEVMAAEPTLVTLRVVDSLEFEQIVDQNGERVGPGRIPEPTVESVVYLSPDANGRWRIADWQSTTPPRVEL